MPGISHRTKKIIIAVVVIIVIAAGVWIYGKFDPEKIKWFPKCMFKTLTGLKCPGCGSQRAIHQLLHGNVAGAFHYNAFLVCCIPVLLFLFSAEWLKNRFPAYHRLSHHPVVSWSLVALILLWWVFRNIFGW